MVHPIWTPSIPAPTTPRAMDEASVALQRRLRWLNASRLIVVGVLLAVVIWLTLPADRTLSFTGKATAGLIALTVVLTPLFMLWNRSGRSLVGLAMAQVAWDLLLTTGLVYVSGGAGSFFSMLFGVVVLVAAIVIGPKAASVAGTIGLSLYAATALGLSNGWLPPPPDQGPSQYMLDGAALGFALASNTLAILVVTVLAGNLASRLRRTGGELQQAEERVARLAQLNDDIVRSLTTGLVATTFDGLIQTANPMAAKLFGTTEEDLRGRRIATLLPLGPGDAYLGKRSEGEATRPDGSRFPVGFVGTALVDMRGRRLGSLFSFQDLTEITALREIAARSERLAALGRLSAGLAHEIRNPLGSISGSVELIASTASLGEEDQRLLKIVITEVDRLNHLVETMLRLGRPTKPSLTLTNLSELTADVVSMASTGPLSQRGVTLEASLPEQPIIASVDPDQIRQVLWNLLKNAVQASPEGGRVTASLSVEPDHHWSLSIADQGEGVADDAREKIFEMFASGRRHGVGLGLALVKQIVDGHGGRTEVLANPEGGALFRVVMPIDARPSKP